MKIKMDISTFNDLAEKKANGAFALLTGKVKVDGSFLLSRSMKMKLFLNIFLQINWKSEI